MSRIQPMDEFVVDCVKQAGVEKRERDKRRNEESYIYLFFCEGLTKIGYSLNPEQRLRECQTGSAGIVTMILKVQVLDAYKVEKWLHSLYENKREHGEWFRLSRKNHLEIRDVLNIDKTPDTGDMKGLIEAFNIFLKYGNITNPTLCLIESMYVHVNPCIVSKDDTLRLEQLGFKPEISLGCFVSDTYGG